MSGFQGKKKSQSILHSTIQNNFSLVFLFQKISASRHNFASVQFKCKRCNIELQLKFSLFTSSENGKINMKIKNKPVPLSLREKVIVEATEGKHLSYSILLFIDFV